ncbi:MAG TPA: thermonuclease family protein [Candidatus Paceibacterota bacterium]|nr:thermonuclease family protein [Candidatus Paceibacterota bacterium]
MHLNHKRLLLIIGPIFILVASLLDLFPQRLELLVPKVREVKLNTTSQNSNSTNTATIYTILRIIDGDTITVGINGIETKIRLIGVNAPESVDPRRPLQCYGKEAAAHLSALLEQRKVTLVFDDSQDRYDKYGRLLAYVYRDDGLLINSTMIRDGYAYEYTYITPYVERQNFKQAERDASKALLGLWSPKTCSGKL